MIRSYKSSKQNSSDIWSEQVPQKLYSLAMDTSRLDVVFNVYRDRSLKQETRENRGATDTRVSLKKETPLSHKNFSDGVESWRKQNIDF